MDWGLVTLFAIVIPICVWGVWVYGRSETKDSSSSRQSPDG